MSRAERRTLIGTGLLVLLFTALEVATPQPVDWSRSYSRLHRTPYGAKLVYEGLEELFPKVVSVYEPVMQALRRRTVGHALEDPVNHVYVNTEFALDGFSTDKLLSLVEAGDNLLIAADRFQGHLADTLGVSTYLRLGFMSSDTTELRFSGDARIAEGLFRLALGHSGAYFGRYDEARCRVLAVDGGSRPVLLDMAWGRGRIVLCSTPLALTNFHLLKDRNATLMAGILSTLPPLPLHWDEFYKVGRSEASSPLRFVLMQPPLRWAWYITLALIAMFLVFRTRREQRPIPVIKPPANASREMLQTIGRLYWQRADHAALARRMVAHLKEDLRTHTYLKHFAYDDATTAHLAAKTGLDLEEMARRMAEMQHYEQARRVSEVDLLHLSERAFQLQQLIGKHGKH